MAYGLLLEPHSLLFFLGKKSREADLSTSTFTELFDRGRRGDSFALDLAYRIVFAQLRRTAAGLLDRERNCRTMQPTALVGEFYLKVHRIQCQVLNREHFLGLATRAMKQLLIDRGRGKAVRRRLDPEMFATFSDAVQPESASRLAVRQVWERLRDLDPLAAETIWRMKAEGMTLHEVARSQYRPIWRVQADCEFALDWMRRKLD